MLAWPLSFRDDVSGRAPVNNWCCSSSASSLKEAAAAQMWTGRYKKKTTQSVVYIPWTTAAWLSRQHIRLKNRKKKTKVYLMLRPSFFITGVGPIYITWQKREDMCLYIIEKFNVRKRYFHICNNCWISNSFCAFPPLWIWHVVVVRIYKVASERLSSTKRESCPIFFLLDWCIQGYKRRHGSYVLYAQLQNYRI